MFSGTFQGGVAQEVSLAEGADLEQPWKLAGCPPGGDQHKGNTSSRGQEGGQPDAWPLETEPSLFSEGGLSAWRRVPRKDGLPHHSPPLRR